MSIVFTNVNLNDLCRPRQWPTIAQANLTASGYPVFGANGRIGYYTEFNHEHPTILITCRGATCGTINVCDPKSYVTGNAMALDDLDPSRVDLRYTFYALTRRGLADAITGTAQPQITRASLAGVEIPLPYADDPVRSLREQKRIAAILDKADAIRRKRQEAVEAAAKFPPSLFTKMFGRSGSNYRSEPLDTHLRFLTSGSRGWAEHYARIGKRFIRSLDVQMNRIGSDDIVFVDPPAGTEANRTRVQDGDVLVTITGSRIGRVAFVPDSFGEAYVSQHVAIARLLPSLRPRYCSMFLSLPDGGQRQIAKAQYGQTKPGLSLTNIREFQIPIPPVTEQDRFIDSWTRYEDMAVRTHQGSRELDDLFDSLVQRAFRGDL